jgi:hypothetical protein
MYEENTALHPEFYDQNISAKRTSSKSIECQNCGCEHDPQTGFEPKFRMDQKKLHWSRQPWCSAECFLSYSWNRLTPVQYEILHSDVEHSLGRPVVARPSRLYLEQNGGNVPIHEYVPEMFARVEKMRKRTKLSKSELLDEAVFASDTFSVDAMTF